MRSFLPNTNLQIKFKLLTYLGILIFLINILVVYYQMTNLNHRLQNLELAEDFHNTVQEVRRYEKNFLLYHDKESITSNQYYLQQAQKLFLKILTQFKKSSAKKEIGHISEALEKYSSYTRFYKISDTANLDQNIENEIRSAGKQVIDTAAILLKLERRHIAKAAQNALQWPIIFMGAVLLLFILGARSVTTKVVRPLTLIERATEKVAGGDFSTIEHSGKNESQVDHLVVAFNRMAQELEAREEQVIQSRKIASLGTLVSGVAHELNNPINNIVLTADVLNKKKEISEGKRALLVDDILKQSLRASEIVKNLLEYSRAETSAYKKLDIVGLLRETIHIAKNHMAMSHVKLHDKMTSNLPKINGNRQGLQQVFLNLLTNAVHAMDHGGDLTIRTSFGKNNKIKVEVEDTGTGISEDNLPHIFDPFFTTKDVGKGTGLGLSVSFGIIKKHGGQISVKSKVDQGTTFTVLLPVYEEKKNV